MTRDRSSIYLYLMAAALAHPYVPVPRDPLEPDYIGPDPKPRPPRKNISREPHQGKRERERRLRQAAKAKK